MRFINTTSLRFEELDDEDLLKPDAGYAIFSHRWRKSAEDEVLYYDISNPSHSLESKPGYAKFSGACSLARSLGFSRIWIDTCCINKSDSAELGEAINSMYRWYSQSKLCIAYLEDICSEDVSTTTADWRGDPATATSQWFDRGWTLQELIAPERVDFYGRTWNLLGNKSLLSRDISMRTGIPIQVLRSGRKPQDYSVAQRFSWAARRKTKRVEDQAYCLMGLFNVNMPMIYGERERAFIRLQEHIIQQSADESIFAWDVRLLESYKQDPKYVYCGLLASSPSLFERCGSLVISNGSKGFQLTQFGISITLQAFTYAPETRMVRLNVRDTEKLSPCFILLTRLSTEEDTFVRISDDRGQSVFSEENSWSRSQNQKFMVSVNPARHPAYVFPGFDIKRITYPEGEVGGSSILSRGTSAERDCIYPPCYDHGVCGVVMLSTFRKNLNESFGFVQLGFNETTEPFCRWIFPTTPMREHWRSLMNDFEVAHGRSSGSEDRYLHPVFTELWGDKWESMASQRIEQPEINGSSVYTELHDLVVDGFTYVGSISMRKRVDLDANRKHMHCVIAVWTVTIEISEKYDRRPVDGQPVNITEGKTKQEGKKRWLRGKLFAH